MTILRLDNVGIVVDGLDAAVAFFTEFGMELGGRMQIEGRWTEKVVGLDDMRREIAMMPGTAFQIAGGHVTSAPMRWPMAELGGLVRRARRPLVTTTCALRHRALRIGHPRHARYRPAADS